MIGKLLSRLAGKGADADGVLVSAQSAYDRQARGEALLIEVRPEAEWRAGGRPAGSVAVPMVPGPAFEEAVLASAGGDVAKPLILTCLTGKRSAIARDRLSAAGHETLHVLDGGIGAWKAARLPVEPA